MYLKYKLIFHDQDAQHSYVDVVMCLMVSRSGTFIFYLSQHRYLPIKNTVQ
jgi:hypothetical protein